MMALTQENVHYTLNYEQVEQSSCADPEIFVRRGFCVCRGGGGFEARQPENSLNNVSFSHQLTLQFTEWIQWFYYRGEEGVQLLPGGGGVLWIRMWGRLTPLFAYRIMVYQNLNKTEKHHPTTTKRKKSYLLLIEIASADPEGGQGVRTPLEKNHKLYGFL